MKELYSLQNGTDIRGVAYKDKNSDLEINLSEIEVCMIAKSFAKWLKNKNKTSYISIALGMDSRVTGPKFRNICAQELVKVGVNVIDCGLATTPSMFMSTILEDYKATGAIMFTASHMPYIYNGMKMFTREGCLNKEDLKEVLDICVEANLDDKIDDIKSNITERNLIDDYSNELKEIIKKGVDSKDNYNKPFAGMKIVVDAGNGAGGFFANKVLEDLGANTKGSQFLEPDGHFPNHIPNPENKEAMKAISKATLNANADLGIIFDTDVDRAAVVSKYGKEINKNALIALISSIVLEENPGSTIVTDSVTSDGLGEYIKLLGGVHYRFKRGYKNVINESIRLNNECINSPLAIETSGHAAMKENYFLDDGAYLVAKILIKAAKMFKENKDVSELISELREAKESLECRIKIKNNNYKEYAGSIIESVKEKALEIEDWEIVEPNYEGVRVKSNKNNQQGWFLLRSSLHEPLLVLNIESDVENGSKALFDNISSILKSFDLEFPK
ncbi:phosphomannomutase/phosphoglucomutase [Peptostreptococcus equinus]|uniref:Phosphomannomutase/phosphoglucomutase n=1 Tax=Peptostreptococcus equinus TaxID=3003601 RepID=A0ABY7JKZ0_9FIRM|nr:phosphomannomutase/phosphoglucomutase [Peptostreptococcus sp. CBA3647]WAW14020.1 phosphomannomutase/phosphoglucomutase [Peptostreptococcus sp. CBA3647]